MVSIGSFSDDVIRKTNPHFSQLKTTVESAFYSNNTRQINTIKEAYDLAASLPQTIVLDANVKHAKELGLNEDAKMLLVNDGATVGRTAKARRIVGFNPEEDKKLMPIVREAIYDASLRPFIKGQAFVGLDEDFMIKAHITMPEKEANNLYSWLMNFQIVNESYNKMYRQSKEYDENDIYVFFDPEWSHPDYPDGLSYIDPQQNVACILGMNYFGETKKGTLTLAWSSAHRNKYVACHGGLKKFKSDNGENHVASFFGLSGSGKSTLTHAKHNNRYEIEVLHDDAFIISVEDGSSVALEPAYFDKTNDYPAGHVEQDYFVTIQNTGVTLNQDGKKVLVTEDIRNGNGRTVKSRYSTPNRVDKIDQPINAIYWIMKDDSLPPLVKITDPLLASVFGCTLATKRSSAENTTESLDKIVIEPYANPFRVYPLAEDFMKFKELFDNGAEAYIINTGEYLGQKVKPEHSLAAIESVVDKNGEFRTFGAVNSFEYLVMDDFPVPLDDSDYLKLVQERMQTRLDFILQYNLDNPTVALDQQVATALANLIESLN
ncbi:phosphoenolpyruvate carboxykinase (ATP) [Aerococcaceae bacterium WGS1372]